MAKNVTQSLLNQIIDILVKQGGSNGNPKAMERAIIKKAGPELAKRIMPKVGGLISIADNKIRGTENLLDMLMNKNSIDAGVANEVRQYQFAKNAIDPTLGTKPGNTLIRGDRARPPATLDQLAAINQAGNRPQSVVEFAREQIARNATPEAIANQDAARVRAMRQQLANSGTQNIPRPRPSYPVATVNPALREAGLDAMGVPAVSATRIPPQIDPRAVEQARNIALEQATERLPVNPPPVPKTVVSPKPSSSLTSAVNALDNAAEKVIDGGSKAEKGGLFSKMFGPKNVKALEKLATKYPAAAKILKSKALGPAISGVIAVNEISEGKDPAKAIVGDVLGGWAGAEAGLAGGAALGSLAGPIGTAVGGLGGAVLGGMGGAGLANSLLDSLFDRTKEPKQVVDQEEERLNKIALEYAKKRLAAEESPRGRLLDSIGGTGTSTRKYDRQAGRNMRELDRALKSLGR